MEIQNNFISSQNSIDDLLHLIPPRFYLQQENDQETAEELLMQSKFIKNKKQYKLEKKRKIKELAREAKRNKLDPDHLENKTVDEMKMERKKKKEEAAMQLDKDDDSEEDNVPHSTSASSIASSTVSSPSSSQALSSSLQPPISSSLSTTSSSMIQSSNELRPMKAASISELKERLHARMAELRAKRNGGIDLSQVDIQSLPKSKQEIIQKRMKKKEEKKLKKEQQQQRKQSSKGNMDKKRKLEEMENNNNNNDDVNGNKQKNMKRKEIQEDVSFGRIEFGGEEVLEANNNKKKGPTDTLGKLKKAEKEKSKLEELQKKNPEKASKIEESIHWNKILSRAQGEKVKDDTALLKKTLKREQKTKEKSKKTWEDRESTVRNQQEERQKRRQENLQARKDGNPTKRNNNSNTKRPGSKKMRPGFEGGHKKKKIK